MKADEYDDLINDPTGYLIDVLLPRILGELGDRGTGRSHVAMLKAGFAQMMWGATLRNRQMVSGATVRDATAHGRSLLGPL